MTAGTLQSGEKRPPWLPEDAVLDHYATAPLGAKGSGDPDKDVWALVLADMLERRQVGIDKYNSHIEPASCTDPLVNAYQEALDLVVYLRTEIERRTRR